jgi:hypothetical protein
MAVSKRMGGQIRANTPGGRNCGMRSNAFLAFSRANRSRFQAKRIFQIANCNLQISKEQRCRGIAALGFPSCYGNVSYRYNAVNPVSTFVGRLWIGGGSRSFPLIVLKYL